MKLGIASLRPSSTCSKPIGLDIQIPSKPEIAPLAPEDLKSVDELMKQNSGTLGFLPFEALKDHQQKGCIIGAKTNVGELVGYILYGKNDDQFRIAQLCVSDKHRKKGIAKQLVESLLETATSQKLIKLTCRDDYPANEIWYQLEFVPYDHKPGRSAARHPLTIWHRKLAQDDQLDLFQALVEDEHFDAVIDAQILMDLDELDKDKTVPSKSLASDFLADKLNLWITDELLVEINRSGDPDKQATSRSRAHEFLKIDWNPKSMDFYVKALQEFMTCNNESQVSDIRHLAKTAASKVDTFVTRDDRILRHKDKILESAKVRVLSPTELILKLFEDSDHIVPDRISGHDVSWQPIESGEIASLAAQFTESNQKHWQLKEELQAFLSQPQRYTCEILNIRDEKVAIRVLANDGCNSIDSPFTKISNSFNCNQINEFVVAHTIAKGISTRHSLIRFVKKGISQNLVPTILGMGFIEHQDAYIRFTIPEQMSLEKVHSYLTSILPDASGTFHTMNKLMLEYFCSPLCIPGSQPTFMIPIKPSYAMNLFDTDLAKQDLFGGNPDILLRQENVYYRKSTHHKMLRSPARLLWYLSKPNSAVVAVSHLNKVEIDNPKQLYRSFKKYGTLVWREIYKMCDQDISTDLMALKFDHTFKFMRSVPLIELQKIFAEHGKKLVLQSPSAVTQEIFEAIFEYGYNSQS